MDHFKYYPKIEYCDELAVNIMVRNVIRERVNNNQVLYYEYTVRDGEKPETISSDYYGTSNNVWLILYANNILDARFDWALGIQDFHEFVKDKYGTVEKAQIDVHHYLLDNTYIIDQTTYEDINIEAHRKKIVTNYEYEFQVNEAKRNIKVIDTVHAQDLITELQRMF
jgi:hypothetical protein